MKIPKGSQIDTKLMMRGKGIPYLNRGKQKGNQIVHLKITIPKKITARQEELLREFDAESEKSGLGISGRLAQAAGSAFKSFFGGKSSKSDSSNQEDKRKENKDNDEEREKEQKAQ
jgi:DnaJ-class molecular chaperone